MRVAESPACTAHSLKLLWHGATIAAASLARTPGVDRLLFCKIETVGIYTGT
jgi:hypothetical protein